MSDIHPLIDQLRFARSEFERAFSGVSDEDGDRRLMPMNSIGWIVGHLAWQEQRYFLIMGQSREGLYPQFVTDFAFGAPALTPTLSEMIAAWRAVTAAVDPYLDTLTAADMLTFYTQPDGKILERTVGSLLLRTIYHYWYHCGEISSIRQMLGHPDLPQFVGAIDAQAPYRPEE